MKKKNPNPYFENILWTVFAIIAGFISEGYCIVVGRDVGLRRACKKYFFIY